MGREVRVGKGERIRRRGSQENYCRGQGREGTVVHTEY